MFSKVLIANRGTIACRVQRTLGRLGVQSVAVYSDPDEGSLHHLGADEAVHLPGARAADTYLDADRIIAAALDTGAGAIHPGYGFLSEKASFSEACEQAGITFLGPTPAQLRDCGLKHVCRDIARAHDVPLLEGSALLDSPEEALAAAEAIGYPVILKSSAGGGGIGMQIARSPDEVPSLFDQVSRLAASNFGDPAVYLERYIQRARHVEVQCFGDGQGTVVALGDRDCSVQRRNQKIIEECPAPGLADDERARLHAASRRILKSLDYRSAGTVEFLWDDIERSFFLLEVNARLQVEHGVTEEVFGVDLVGWMLQLGAGELGELSALRAALAPSGHAVQARIYAEDPAHDFRPSTGLVTAMQLPASARVETGIAAGDEVGGFYDPMVAKLIVHGPDRASAITGLSGAVAEFRAGGIETNRAYLLDILGSDNFLAPRLSTALCSSITYRPRAFEVVDPGLETTVQDFPGRVGMWDVGVPPSGPFDSYSFRLGNRLLGNPAGAAGLEMLVRGGSFRFFRATTVCLAGADTAATLDGEPVPPFTPTTIPAGGLLRTGTITGPGQRAYLLVAGGIDVSPYLGSAATFRLGRFGGHGGRALLPGDMLHLGPTEAGQTEARPEPPLPDAERPGMAHRWNLRVTYGPHAAPEFFTGDDIATFFSATWEVHYNSDRTGIRLIGPKPAWARRDGGEAGLHPSNIHDNAYTVGSVDFTGDMPILLGPDGPSLGGFVCPAVVIRADLWKMGQLKPGDTVRFSCVTLDEAESLGAAHEATILGTGEPAPAVAAPAPVRHHAIGEPVLSHSPAAADRPSLTIRASGDGVLLAEFGEMELDLDLRFRAQALHDAIRREPFQGLLELVPGIRSLQVQFDPALVRGADVLSRITALEADLPPVDEMEFPSRIVHLPLSWDDPATIEAIEKYTQIVRPDAPWCPSNIEFIRRINGLGSVDEVRASFFDSTHLVLGLGDVYLGAPVCTPLDPRHRFVTTKYNPARTWTAENSVGIGGAYLCIYGMEGPGGYQFVGRTLPVWNRFRTTPLFVEGTPWLLRFFDQIRWYPIGADELLEARKQFLTGRYEVRVEETTFRPSEYRAFLAENAGSIEAFRIRQRQAFAEERQRWEESGAMNFQVEETSAPALDASATTIPEGCEGARSPVAGTVWKFLVAPGDTVEEGQDLAIVESMKMEIPLPSPCAGTVSELLAEPSGTVAPGQPIILVESS